MDELYENLDNYDEENRISELQTENKELKSKLQEYSVAMVKLQKDFDKLSSEYKQLELNYSSLLKTAKAEIERKTQLITNLNIEKDRMVLMSYQNKNSSNLYKARHRDSTTVQQKVDKGKTLMTKGDKLQQLDGKKLPSHSATERIDKHCPRRTNTSPQRDVRSKLLNLAHRGRENDSSTDINSDVKENIMELKKESDASKAKVSIRDGRKSIPAISMETEPQFSDDSVDLVSNASSQNLQQTNTECNSSEKYKHVDHDVHEKPKPKISDTCTSEEKKSEYQELPDSNKQRSSRYDRDKNDKYRVRHKSSHRYKRSPDRYHSGLREYHDSYQRSEHDRYRAKGKISGSPPREAFYQKPSREIHRSNYDRSHPYEHEKSLPRSQERYPIKRRFEHGYDELEKKRLRTESHFKKFEEDRRLELDNNRYKMESYARHHEQDRKNKDEKTSTNKKYVDPLEIQFSSCESPDYDCPDVTNQQVKEIKLTATTKLDDPRTSSKKYILSKNDGKVVLTTTSGRNVDLVSIKRIAWGVEPECMPEALRRPPKHSEKDINNKIDNPANVSIESGEIVDDISLQNHHQKRYDVNIISKDRKEIPDLSPKLEEYKSKDVYNKNVENSLKNILHPNKISKTRTSSDEKQCNRHSREITSPAKQHDNPSLKIDKDSDRAITNIDASKRQDTTGEETKGPGDIKQDSFYIQSKNLLSCLGSSISNECKQIARHLTAKEVVENDLEMSDDNCDVQSDLVTTESIPSTHLENKTLETSNKDERHSIIIEKLSKDSTDKVVSESCKDKTSTNENKKSKTKKKSKHREIKNEEKPKETKITQIKSKFSELFDDSCSLISPEDLGLSSVPTSTSQISNKCATFFEDALDVDDLNRIKADTRDSTLLRKPNVENKQHGDLTTPKVDTVCPVNLENSLDKSDDRSNSTQTELTDDVIKSIYQNLEPGISEEESVVKTVIISTGVQPPILLEDTKQLHHNKDKLQPKSFQHLGLKALATSTPQKIFQPDTESKQRVLDCSLVNSTQIASVEENATMDKSDSNTVDAQYNDANVPDVRIFVKRRRKVTKK